MGARRPGAGGRTGRGWCQCWAPCMWVCEGGQGCAVHGGMQAIHAWLPNQTVRVVRNRPRAGGRATGPGLGTVAVHVCAVQGAGMEGHRAGVGAGGPGSSILFATDITLEAMVGRMEGQVHWEGRPCGMRTCTGRVWWRRGGRACIARQSSMHIIWSTPTTSPFPHSSHGHTRPSHGAHTACMHAWCMDGRAEHRTDCGGACRRAAVRL